MPRFLPRKDIQAFINSTFPARSYVVEPLSGGLLNQNFLLTAGREKLVLKVYRPEMPFEKVEEIHRVMQAVAKSNILVGLPVKSVELGGYAVAVYPFLKGENPKRFGNTPARIHAMGSMLGKLHVAFDTFHTEITKPEPLQIASWDPISFMEKIHGLRERIAASRVSHKQTLDKTLDLYEEIIARGDWSKEKFLKLPIQLCHNDYHTYNILMQKNQITGILDWEKFGWTWRAFEIMRSVIFNCRKTEKDFDWKLIETYLRAYREETNVSALTSKLAFDCGYRKMLFSLWTIEQYVDHGRKELFENILRRASIIKTMADNYDEYPERIAELLK